MSAKGICHWESPASNEFLLVSQFWVTGEIYNRRADLVGFVNGVPLVFVELKASHKALKAAYDGNLTDYRTAISFLRTQVKARSLIILFTNVLDPLAFTLAAIARLADVIRCCSTTAITARSPRPPNSMRST